MSKVEIGFWPTVASGVMLGAVRVQDRHADVTIAGYFDYLPETKRSSEETGQLARASGQLGRVLDQKGMRAGRQGLAIVWSADQEKTRQAVGEMSRQVGAVLAGFDTSSFPAFVVAIGFLIDAADPSVPTILSQAIMDMCSALSEQNFQGAGAELASVIALARQVGLSSVNVTRAIFEGFVRCACDDPKVGSNLQWLVSALSGLIEPATVTATAGRLHDRASKIGWRWAMYQSTGVPIGPWGPEAFEALMRQWPANAESEYEIAAGVNLMARSTAAKYLADFESGRLQIPMAVRQATGKALYDRAADDLPEALSDELFKNVVAYGLNRVRDDGQAIKAWVDHMNGDAIWRAAKITPTIGADGTAMYALARLEGELHNRLGGGSWIGRVWSTLVRAIRSAL